ncbi:MAG: hydrogenase nickel incorporation protein HypB [Deltaproteobacteria bacterium]
MKIGIDREIQRSAEAAAEAIRAELSARRVFAVNLVSSPGSGKTTLIEAAVTAWRDRLRVAVIEGDIETEIDADRIRRHGVPVHQINTRSACHIQPSMLLAALKTFNLDTVDLLFIENVGNLVCPAETSLGEDLRIVALSVTEGDEKPLKYPRLFQTSEILVITKIDLLPHVRFDLERVKSAARTIRPGIEVFETSAATGEGIAPLLARIAALRAAKAG